MKIDPVQFSIQRGYENTCEGLTVIEYCYHDKSNRQYVINDEPIAGSIPVGSIEYCEKLLDKRAKGFLVNFYPRFMRSGVHDWHGRLITLCNNHMIKQADRWKTNEGNRPLAPCYISERIEFINEWRLYIANGKICSVGWYKGADEDLPFPGYDRYRWPTFFSGAVDVGQTNLRIELVEAQPPYACGWYAEREGHAPWLIEAWRNFLPLQHRWWFIPGSDSDRSRW